MSSGPLGIVIVDDEELARGLVREFLASHPEVKILAECSNGFEAVKAISELAPDIVFLDIQMPKLDGFEVLELIPRETGRSPAVIFVTAYDQYAVRAFEKHAVDYLLKPYDRKRFDTSLERARHRLRESSGPPQAPAALAAAARGEPALKRIVVKDGAKVSVLPIETVEFVKAEDDYVLIRSGGNFVSPAAPLKWTDVLRGFNNSTPGQGGRRPVVRISMADEIADSTPLASRHCARSTNRAPSARSSPR